MGKMKSHHLTPLGVVLWLFVTLPNIHLHQLPHQKHVFKVFVSFFHLLKLKSELSKNTLFAELWDFTLSPCKTYSS